MRPALTDPKYLIKNFGSQSELIHNALPETTLKILIYLLLLTANILIF